MSSDCPCNPLFCIIPICKTVAGRIAPPCVWLIEAYSVSTKQSGPLRSYTMQKEMELQEQFTLFCNDIIPYLSWKIISLLHLPLFLPMVGTQVMFQPFTVLMIWTPVHEICVIPLNIWGFLEVQNHSFLLHFNHSSSLILLKM